MAYEIPQNLKYEEKIAFNLSLPQMFWIGLFESTATIIFLKTNLIFELKISIGIILLVVGINICFLIDSPSSTEKHLKGKIGTKSRTRREGFEPPRAGAHQLSRLAC